MERNAARVILLQLDRQPVGRIWFRYAERGFRAIEGVRYEIADADLKKRLLGLIRENPEGIRLSDGRMPTHLDARLDGIYVALHYLRVAEGVPVDWEGPALERFPENVVR